MYYEVLVNDATIGVFGHPDVRNMHLSVMVTKDGPEIFVTGVCAENGDLWCYNWLQKLVASSDIVTFKQSTQCSSVEPRNKYKMRKDNSTGTEQEP
jgi:hypothetical protein